MNINGTTKDSRFKIQEMKNRKDCIFVEGFKNLSLGRVSDCLDIL